MKNKIVTLVLLTALLGGAYVWFYVYNKSHANIHNEDIAFNGTSIELKNQIESHVKFLTLYPFNELPIPSLKSATSFE